ncbi:hypothetical protein [Devosia rhizoryzae]|uniref:Methyl-accepting transducer domain-containing protein n=1 Tax=Devosia rhizoryzae TaxID=2774137 RepID=A0ABX7C5X6_9HYPH|nr:hypothetical protein [Devosia rhizoryzae]QQR39665.1 hypothetical protein JI748_01195 [Devosia rhizoryzae]
MTEIDPARIHRLLEDLARPREAIEHAFVSVGARLTEGAAMLNTLSKLFDALPTALQGAEVEEAVEHLHAVATRAATLSDTFAQEKADLQKLTEVVAAANSPISDLRRTVKMMGIVSVNARVTAAGIVGDNEDFAVFTTDIATLSDSASRTIQDFAQVYRQLTTEVDRAAAQRARFEAAHAHTLTGLAQSLADTIGAIAQQRSSAVDSSAETGRISRQIVGRIGNAVMALQVGDATRQRLEHVETGLARLADLATGTYEGDDLPAAIAALVTLEQSQLSETATSFLHDVALADEALGELAADAGTIMSRSRDFHGKDGVKTSAIASLNAQLRAAVTILKDFEAERGKLETVASAVEGTVRILLEHVEAVQEIEYNMRLVSLNAAVRCAQLGPRGASLTVIAQQLRELTTQTVVAAEAAMRQLDQSAALAGAFASAGDNSAVGALEDQANLALEILGKLDQTIAAALGKLNTDGPKVITLLQTAARGLSGQAALAETLDDITFAIASLTDAPLPTELSPSLDALLETLRKTYTMESERQVHARLFGQVIAAAPANENGGQPEDDLSDFML